MVTTHMSGCTSPIFPLTTLISVYMTKPAPMPTVMLNVRGKLDRRAGAVSDRSRGFVQFSGRSHQSPNQPEDPHPCDQSEDVAPGPVGNSASNQKG